MKRSTVKGLQMLIGLLFFILIIVLIYFNLRGLAFLALVAWFVTSLGLDSQLKCPYCGAWPRRGSFLNSYCPDCGKPFDE